MDSKPILNQEEQRLLALLKTRLLDTPIENRFERITRLVQNVLQVPIASFNLVDKDRQWSKSMQGLSVVEIARNQSFCSHAIQDDQVLLVPDARKDNRFSSNPLVTGNPNIVFYAGCPVKAPTGEKIGALCAIDSKPRELSARELQILRDLAGVLETELRYDEMEEKLNGMKDRLDNAELLAMVDPLTRVWNRAGITEFLKKEWAKGVQDRRALGVIQVDCDHFKTINDTYGRSVGDEVLREIARIILSVMGSKDTLGRLTGDEFMLILPECPQDKLANMMQTIRYQTMMHGIDTKAGTLHPTLSLGGAFMIPQEDADMTDLMRHADEALVMAKKNGRDRAEMYRGPWAKAV